MPLQPVFTSRFQKDVELAKRRGKDTDKLKVVILLLLNQR
jgi:mRNA-degrading endonuclease YafQ of YafQ-DinJ toxin-antitoxin module